MAFYYDEIEKAPTTVSAQGKNKAYQPRVLHSYYKAD